MKKSTAFYILSFFTIFLSVSNIIPELSFRTSDSDAYSLFTAKSEKEEIKVEKTSLTKINKVKTATSQATVAKATTTKKATVSANTSTSKHYDYTHLSYVDVGVGNTVLYDTGSKVGMYRFCSSCAPFLYAHNRPGLFQNLANLKRGDTFTVKVYGATKTYVVQNNFTINLSALNPKEDNANAKALRKSLFTSTYGGKFDITLQTCAGKNDSHRRYIQAFELK